MEHKTIYEVYKDLDKEKLVDYINMYQDIDNLTIKVLEKANREKLVDWIKNEMPIYMGNKL